MKKILAIILIILSIYIWNTDIFQKNVFPENYWQEEIASLEKLIKIYKVDIENQILRNIQFHNNYPIEYTIAYNKLVVGGASETKATELASKYMDIEQEVNDKTLDSLERYLRKNEEKLEVAITNYRKSK